MTRNLARDMVRKGNRDPATFPIAFDDIPTLGFESGITTRLDVNQVLAQLSARDRECLWLFYYAGLSTREISEALRVSNVSVRKRLHRVRRRFFTIWEEDHHAQQ